MQLKKLFCLLYFFTGFVFSQKQIAPILLDNTPVTKQSIPISNIKKYKSNKTFNYSKKAPKINVLNHIASWLKNAISKFFEWLFGVEYAKGIVKFIFTIFPYLILAFLIFLLLKFFLKVNTKKLLTGEKEKPEENFTTDEEIIKKQNINLLINQAVKNKNYRLAIRYYYLLILKNLNKNNYIKWQDQKTNTDYIAEIKVPELKQAFTKITTIYDYVWYGEFPVNAIDFENFKLQFENLNNKLNIA